MLWECYRASLGIFFQIDKLQIMLGALHGENCFRGLLFRCLFSRMKMKTQTTLVLGQ